MSDDRLEVRQRFSVEYRNNGEGYERVYIETWATCLHTAAVWIWTTHQNGRRQGLRDCPDCGWVEGFVR